MNEEHNDIDRAISAICDGAYTESTLELIDTLIDRDDASRLLLGILFRERASSKTDDGSVSKTMLRLDSLSEVAEPAACILMAHLWSIADDLYMRDISDSIDLRIADCDSGRLTSQLKSMVASENDEDVKRHFESLIQLRSQSS